MKEVGVAMSGSGSNDGTMSVRKDAPHLRDFILLISVVILHDAHCVDPEIAKAESICYYDAVP